MKIYFFILSFLQYYTLIEGVQPYFPSLTAFSLYNDNEMIMAIDQVNQKAFAKYHDSQRNVLAYLMKRFPYAIPGTPQSKYYVMLINDTLKSTCMYHTYYENGTRYASDYFPSFWYNEGTYSIMNYMKYYNAMIKSSNTSLNEDYWYSNKTCTLGIEQTIYPCKEIYFMKNTNIPLRYFNVRLIGGYPTRIEIPFTVLSIGKSISKFFQNIPKNWQSICQNGDPSFVF